MDGQGSYSQVSVKFKDFYKTFLQFQGLKTYEKDWLTRENSTSEMLESITKDIRFRKSV